MKKLLLPLICSLSFGFSVQEVSFEDEILRLKTTKIESNLINQISHDEIIKCKENIKFVYEILSQNEIFAYAKSGLHKGKTYQCADKNGFEFSFESEKFEISKASQISPKDYILIFNDEVDLENLKKNLNFYQKNILSKNQIPFSISTKDDKTFIISTKKHYENAILSIDKNLISKFQARLDGDFLQDFSQNKPEFKDRKNAISIQDAIIKPKSFDNGNLGFSILFKNWVEGDKNFIKIDGINDFLVSGAYYNYNQGYDFAIDVQSLEFEPNKEYQITILRGFGDDYNIFRDDFKASFITGHRKPFVKFSDDKKYLTSNSQITFLSSNIDEIKVTIEKVGSQNLRYFLNYSDENLHNLTSQVLSKNFKISNKKDEISEQELSLDFSGYKDGIYKINIFFDEIIDDKKVLRSIEKVVYLSDISAIVKLGVDEIFILGIDLARGEILEYAKVVLYSKNNEILLETNTDKNGVINHKMKNFIDKNPASMTIEKGEKQSFLIIKNPLNKQDEIEENTLKNRALIHFATNLIKPNEELMGVVILKDNNFKSLSNLPIKYQITDQYDKEILSKSSKTDDFGLVKINEKLPNASIGSYNFKVFFEDLLISQKKIFIENFTPHRVKSEILLDKESYDLGQIVTAKVVSNYLFGMPAANLSGTSTLKITNHELKLKEFENFSFSNKLNLDNIKGEIYNKSIKLNDFGKAEILYKLNTLKPSASLLKGMIASEILDDAKSIRETKEFLIYPYKTMVGLASSSNFVEQNQKVSFDGVLINPKTLTRENSELFVQIYQTQWSYVLGQNDVFRWQESFNLLDSFDINGTKFSYEFGQSGDYVVVLSDKFGGHSASVDIFVSGYDFGGLNKSKNLDKATIKLDQNLYTQGSKIKADINSAIKEGVALVTLQDEKIRQSKVVKFDSHKILADFEIPSDFTGGHISATIFKKASKSTQPIRAYANQEVIIDRKNHENKITLNLPKTAQNNQNIEVSISALPNSKVAVFITDEGVLNIISQKILKAFDYFNLTKKLNIFDFDILDEINLYSSKAKLLKFGSGYLESAALKAFQRNSDPLKTKKEKTFQMMKILDLNSNGLAKFSFKTPNNFNSKLRVTSIALNKETIGSNTDFIEVKDDIVVKIANINHLTQNDFIKLPITLINTSQNDENLALSLNTSPNLQANLTQDKIELASKQSTTIFVELNATKTGKAKLNLQTKSKKSSFLASQEFDILNQFPISIVQKSGYAKQAQIKLDDGYKNANLSLSTSPKILIEPQIEKLLDYPYGHTQNLASNILNLSLMGDSNLTKDEIQSKNELIKEGFSRIIWRLKDSGKFGFWSEFGEVDGLASIFAADVILELNKNLNLISKKQENLILKGLLDFEDDKFLTMYASYILNIYKKLTKTQINYLFDNQIFIINDKNKSDSHNLVALYMMADILRTNGLTNELKFIKNKIVNFDFKAINDSFANQNLAFSLYLHSLKFEDDRFSENFAKTLMDNLEKIQNNLESAFLIRAFYSYFKDNKEKIVANINNQNYTFNGNFKINLEGNLVNFKSEKGLFYSVSSKANAKLRQNSSDKKTGKISITREFVDKNGKKIELNNLKLGDIVYSKILLKTNQYTQKQYVDEQISPCFEPVNENFSNNIRGENVQNSINYENQSISDERVVTFLEPFSKNALFFTPLKVVLSGKCHLSPIFTGNTKSSELYDYFFETDSFVVK